MKTPFEANQNLLFIGDSITRKLAGEFDAIFVDVQAAFDRYLPHQPTQSLCGDRVHPNGVGHMIIARAFLDAVGL